MHINKVRLARNHRGAGNSVRHCPFCSCQNKAVLSMLRCPTAGAGRNSVGFTGISMISTLLRRTSVDSLQPQDNSANFKCPDKNCTFLFFHCVCSHFVPTPL